MAMGPVEPLPILAQVKLASSCTNLIDIIFNVFRYMYTGWLNISFMQYLGFFSDAAVLAFLLRIVGMLIGTLCFGATTATCYCIQASITVPQSIFKNMWSLELWA